VKKTRGKKGAHGIQKRSRITRGRSVTSKTTPDSKVSFREGRKEAKIESEKVKTKPSGQSKML